MKSLWAKGLLAVLVIALIASTGCITIVVEEKGGDKGAVSTEKEAIDTLAEFGIVNQLAVLGVLEMFSDDFSQPLFGEKVSLSEEDYDAIFALMEELSTYEEPVMTSLGILVPEELASHPQLYACLVQPGSYVVPGYASPGICSSFLDFFSFLGGTGKRSRNRILELTKNATDVEKRDLFGSLPTAQQKGATDHNEWFQKLRNGELDNKAARIHNTFMTDPAYLSNASAKGERPIDVAHKEGAQMVTKGAKFYVDAGTTAVGAALPGFASGVQKVQDLSDKVEKYKKYAKTFYEKGMKETVKQAVKDKFDGIVTGGMNEVLGENVSDVVTHLTQQVTGKGKPSEWVELSPNYGKAKIMDSDKTSKPQVAIALNKDENASMQMITYVGDESEPTLNLPQGGYLIVAADKDGNSDKDTSVQIVGGQETKVTMDTSDKSAEGLAATLVDKLAGKDKQDDSSAAPEKSKTLLEILKELQDAALAALKKGVQEDNGKEVEPGDGTTTGMTGDTGAILGENPFVSMVLNEQEAGALGLVLLKVHERENGVSATYYYDRQPSSGWGGDFRMDLSVALGPHTLAEDISLEGKVSGCESCRYPDCVYGPEPPYWRPCYSLPAIEYTYVDAKGYTNFGVDVLDRNAVDIGGETVFAQSGVRVTIQTSKFDYAQEVFEECKSKHDEFVSAISAKIGAGVQTKTTTINLPELKSSYDFNALEGRNYPVIGGGEAGTFGEQLLTGVDYFEPDDLSNINVILSNVKFQLDNKNLPQQKRNEHAQHYHNLLQANANVQSHDLYTQCWQDTAFIFLDKTISYHPVIGGGYSVVKASLQLAMGKYKDAAMTLAGAIPWKSAGTRLSLVLDYWTIIHTADTALYPYKEDITYFKPPRVYIPPAGYGGYGLR